MDPQMEEKEALLILCIYFNLKNEVLYGVRSKWYFQQTDRDRQTGRRMDIARST